jgi:hypothetical protein
VDGTLFGRAVPSLAGRLVEAGEKSHLAVSGGVISEIIGSSIPFERWLQGRGDARRSTVARGRYTPAPNIELPINGCC